MGRPRGQHASLAWMPNRAVEVDIHGPGLAGDSVARGALLAGISYIVLVCASFHDGRRLSEYVVPSTQHPDAGVRGTIVHRPSLA